MTAPAAEFAALPAGACDCHVHVFGPDDRYPMAPERHYTPGQAPADALRAHMDRLGLQRAVIVHPSVYGTDNHCTLESLAALDGAARAVVVPHESVTRQELLAMHARGARGVRVNLESSAARDAAAARAQLERWAARVAAMGWHVQVYAAPQVLLALADDLAKLPAPVVIDHFGLMGTPPEDAAADGRTLTDLLRSGRVHLKLSAPYRLPSPAVADSWARSLAAAAPAALLWGSDWPHTGRDPGRAAREVSAFRNIGSDELLRTLHTWLPTPELRRSVLVENPARLYGF